MQIVMTITMTEKESYELLDKELTERFGEMYVFAAVAGICLLMSNTVNEAGENDKLVSMAAVRLMTALVLTVGDKVYDLLPESIRQDVANDAAQLIMAAQLR